MSVSFDNSAIKIAVRERPSRDLQKCDNVLEYHSTSPSVLIVDHRPFAFDYVFSPEVTQEKLYDDVIKPLVDKVLQGFSCSALAYGQTGTGKSYTMGLNSNQSFHGENVGVIPRCLREIFNWNSNIENIQTFQQREIHVSFVEIYNERVYDLLSDSSTEPIFVRGCKYTGGTREKITTLEECCNILQEGNKNRHVRPTKMNSQSSRSHAIFTIHLKMTNNDGAVSPCLNLVDLAGSEGVRRTGHQGAAMSEGVHINQGLLSIGKVLHALTLGHKVIPYRDSVLSSVLQDSLNPHSYLTLVACISPHRKDLSETLSTLRFAQSAKQLKHTPQINAVLTEIKKNKVRTPFKISVSQNKHTATPNTNPYHKNNSVTKSTMKSIGYHSNTFCTPSKIVRIDSNKFNQSEMGQTPKEKQKQPLYRQPFQKNALSVVSNLLEPNRDSLFDKSNDTIQSRISTFSLNMSTSTTVEALSNNHVISPVIRKCLSECEKIMERKIEQIIERSVQPMPNILRQELIDIVKEMFDKSTMAQRASINDGLDITNLSVSPKKSNAKCQLFTTSSPVFKVPAVPPAQSEISHTESFSQLNISSGNAENTNFFSHCEEQTVQDNVLRRSVRLSSRNDSINVEISCSNSRRQSKRLHSIKENNDKRRSAIILASSINSSECSKNLNGKAKKSVSKRKTTVNNSVISSYFDTSNLENKSTKKQNLANHKKAILELLNKGSMKELQVLPQIGQKTAYQIITQRTLNGRFKSMAQVEKLPVWRGNAWSRFAEVNMLL